MLTFLANFVMLVLIAGFVVFIAGFVWKISVYGRSPAPLKIPTTPAPVTRWGVVWRLLREVALFESLFKGDKWAWVGGYMFHAALAVVLVRHVRYFVDPLPPLLAHLQIAGIVAGIVMVAALGFLFLRRLVIDRVRFISSGADYLILALLLAVGLTGLLMTFLLRPDIVTIKRAMSGLLSFNIQGLPTVMSGDVVFLGHLLLVAVLLLIFPFSKLMHLGGIFFCPTRNQVDNPREVKHVNPWAGD